ncbi:hypothetical protein G6F68_006272 [Rhizopus microsporus]|nr:hypothetical protein G6F69_001892 [Rhizopus microsporus]KAG1261995.1 hypothetical protein G6F68_006272 [Rhizopus microsporus]
MCRGSACCISLTSDAFSGTYSAAAINPSERQQPCRADVSIALNSTHRDIEDDEAAIDDYDQFFDEEESNRLDQNFLDDDNNGSNPSDLTMAYHPGRENEYYLQHHNDGDNNSNFVSPYDNQEAHDHRTAVSNEANTTCTRK